MVRLADSASTKGAGTCLRPREEARDRFPFFSFVRGGDGMRKTLILLVVPLLLLSSACAFAYHRPIAKPCYGDPDEFQAYRCNDKGGRGLAILGDTRRERPAVMGTSEGERRESKEDARRYLTINFAGRTFFLEK
jgi:hypothetical protein